MSGALTGLRVIDCSRLIAGGVLATILADHGADVIKVENPDPELGTVRMTAPTPRLGETPAAIHWAGPVLGAHNRDVYGSLGLDDAELHALSRDGII